MSDYFTVAKVADVPEGQARVVNVAGQSIALCHVVGDDFYAIENVCTHDEGPLGEGTLREDRIECPRHGALFDVKTGAAKSLPAVRDVKSFAVRVDGEEIQIAVD